MSLELKNVNNSGYTELRNLYNSGYFSLAFSGSEVPTTTTTTSTTSTTTTAPTTTTTTTTTTTSTTTTTTTAAPTTSTTTTTTTAAPTTTTSTTTTTTTAAPTTTTTTTSTTTTTTTAAPTTTTSTTTTTTTAASGDLIRAALQSVNTASYDAAAIGSFVAVNSASYNNVFSTLSNMAKYGHTDAQINGANGGGTAWGSPFAFAFTASIIPSGSYIIGYSAVMRSAVTQSLALYYTTASNATASTAIGERIAPANSFVSTGTDTRYYFIRKAPTNTLPANSVLYLWSTGSLTIKGPNIARIPYKLVNGPAPLQITGSWLSWDTANTGQPGHQFIATSQLQW